VLSAPADKLPAPVTLAVAPAPAVSQPVHLVGYESDRTVEPATFAAFLERGDITKVSRDAQGELSGFVVRSAETPLLAFALVVNSEGDVIGYCIGTGVNALSRTPDDYRVSPATDLFELLETRITILGFECFAGDTRHVRPRPF
jgi:hypothetical protein